MEWSQEENHNQVKKEGMTTMTEIRIPISLIQKCKVFNPNKPNSLPPKKPFEIELILDGSAEVFNQFVEYFVGRSMRLGLIDIVGTDATAAIVRKYQNCVPRNLTLMEDGNMQLLFSCEGIWYDDAI
jgi:hypothetical protein